MRRQLLAYHPYIDVVILGFVDCYFSIRYDIFLRLEHHTVVADSEVVLYLGGDKVRRENELPYHVFHYNQVFVRFALHEFKFGDVDAGAVVVAICLCRVTRESMSFALYSCVRLRQITESKVEILIFVLAEIDSGIRQFGCGTGFQDNTFQVFFIDSRIRVGKVVPFFGVDFSRTVVSIGNHDAQDTVAQIVIIFGILHLGGV